jgi:hypothetical protein
MTADPQPRVGTFQHPPSDSDHAVSSCTIHAAGGGVHLVDVTLRQAKALSLELSRAILAYELVAMDKRQSIRLAAAAVTDVPVDGLGTSAPAGLRTTSALKSSRRP